MSLPIRGQFGHLGFPIGSKDTNVVEDVAILLLVKFRLILFSGCREEVENVSANQRPGRPSWYSERPKTHTWYKPWLTTFMSCFLSSFVEFCSVAEKRWEMSINQRPVRSSCFPTGSRDTNFVDTLRSCLLTSFVKFCSAFSRRSRKCFSQPEARSAILISRPPPPLKTHKLSRGH